MAEIFGTVASALSVAALFNNCVDCFEYIQLGRHFGKDFERCQLKIDIAKTRLSRWGQAVNINDPLKEPQFDTASPDDPAAQQVKSILEEIALLFRSIQKTSERYKLKAKQEDLVCFQDGDMSSVGQNVHGQLETITRQRQKRTGIFKKAAWALYDGKHFEKLIGEIILFVGELEELYPLESAIQSLVIEEVGQVNDEPSLLALQEAAVDTDTVFSDAVSQKVLEIAGRNYAREIKSIDTAKVLVGNQWSEAALSGGTGGLSDRTDNAADSVAASGKSAVQIGNRYGGRDLFDN